MPNAVCDHCQSAGEVVDEAGDSLCTFYKKAPLPLKSEIRRQVGHETALPFTRQCSYR